MGNNSIDNATEIYSSVLAIDWSCVIIEVWTPALLSIIDVIFYGAHVQQIWRSATTGIPYLQIDAQPITVPYIWIFILFCRFCCWFSTYEYIISIRNINIHTNIVICMTKLYKLLAETLAQTYILAVPICFFKLKWDDVALRKIDFVVQQPRFVVFLSVCKVYIISREKIQCHSYKSDHILCFFHSNTAAVI